MTKTLVTAKNLERIKEANNGVIAQLQKQIRLASKSMNRTEGKKQAKRLRAKLNKAVALQGKLTNPDIMATAFSKTAKAAQLLEKLDA